MLSVTPAPTMLSFQPNHKQITSPYYQALNQKYSEPSLYPTTTTTPLKSKKKVQFARNLCAVRYFDNRLPTNTVNGIVPAVTKLITPKHQLIGSESTTYLLNHKVCLDSIQFDESRTKLVGTIKVLNLAYDKDVQARFTLNLWSTYQEVQANYLRSQFDSNVQQTVDLFRFQIELPKFMLISNKFTEFNVQLALRYQTNNTIYWDSNGSDNYVVKVFPSHKLDASTVDLLIKQSIPPSLKNLISFTGPKISPFKNRYSINESLKATNLITKERCLNKDTDFYFRNFGQAYISYLSLFD